MTSSSVVEFLYITLKPSVKPEDPSNHDGQSFLSALTAVKQQSGYKWSSWGRTLEDENGVVLVVGWRDTTTSIPLDPIAPHLAHESIPISIHATLTPAISEEVLASAPVTELAVLAFSHALSPEEKSALNGDLIDFRSALLNLSQPKQQNQNENQTQTQASPPAWFSMAWVDRPGKVQHPDSPSEHAFLSILVVGWQSKEQHEAVRQTEEFGKAIAPIRSRMLKPAKGLEMRHVRFQGGTKQES